MVIFSLIWNGAHKYAIAFHVFVAILVALIRNAVLGGLISNIAIAAPGLAELTSIDRVWAMLSLGGRVAGLLFWPTTLNPHYGPSVLPPDHGPTLAAIATLITLVGLLAVFSFGATIPRGRGRRDARPLYLASAGAAMLIA